MSSWESAQGRVRLHFNPLILFWCMQREGKGGGRVGGFKTTSHTQAFTSKGFNALKKNISVHCEWAKKQRRGKRAAMPGRNQHLHFPLNHQWLLKWPLVTVVQGLAEDFSPFLCPAPPLPVCLSSSNTCSSPSLPPLTLSLSPWPNFPLVLKVTHTLTLMHTLLIWKWVWDGQIMQASKKMVGRGEKHTRNR